MTMITLRTHGGHYLSAGPEGWLSAESTERTAVNLFELVELGEEKVLIKGISPANYLCVREGRLCAASSDAQAAETFTLCDMGQGRVALRSAGGQYLCAEGGGGSTVVADRAEAGPWETFDLERHDGLAEALAAATCCCGMQHSHPVSDHVAAAAQSGPVDSAEVGATWEDKTHRWLVESAVAILLYHKAALSEAQIFDRFWTNANFRYNVFLGLLHADYVSPYKDGAYSSHFFDPATRQNIFGNTDWTAYTQCLKYFTESRNRALQIEKGKATGHRAYAEAGYVLGLSLHYLTDLTQPMHAANFANFLPTLHPLDLRHSFFEMYFERIIQGKDDRNSPNYDKARALQVDPASVPPSYFKAPDYSTIGQLIEMVALHSRNIFINYVKPRADAKVVTIYNNGMPHVIIKNEWTAAEADPAIQAAVPYGQRLAARYLFEWARRS